MKVALVHDGIFCKGGAERVFLNFKKAFPDAQIFTSIYDPDFSYSEYKNYKINTSWIQNIISNEQNFKKFFFPLGLYSMRTHNLANYDVILTSTTHCGKYITAKKNILVINYCYTPFRLAWNPESYNIYQKSSGIKKYILKIIINILKNVDYKYAQRANKYIAMTEETAGRIKKHYSFNKNIKIINPSINLDNYFISQNIKNYYLVVSRLEKYKQVDLVIETFNKLGYQLKIVGNGSEEKYLKSKAKNNIEFLSEVNQNHLSKLYSECKALIFPQHEDYGLTPLETNASGRPVIAYGFGGVLTTMIPYNENKGNNFTAVFFKKQTIDSLTDAINKLSGLEIDTKFIRENAENFDDKNFINKIKKYVKEEYRNFKN